MTGSTVVNGSYTGSTVIMGSYACTTVMSHHAAEPSTDTNKITVTSFVKPRPSRCDICGAPLNPKVGVCEYCHPSTYSMVIN